MDTSPPSAAPAGTAFEYQAGEYSAEDYTLQFALNNGVDNPDVTEGVADDTKFTVTGTLPTKPGRYQWAEVYTKIVGGGIYYGPRGYIDVTPSMLDKGTPSHARKMVTNLEAVMLKFSQTDKSSVSFGGHSFTRDNIANYREELSYWQGVLAREQAAIDAANGEPQSGFIHVQFIPPQCLPR